MHTPPASDSNALLILLNGPTALFPDPTRLLGRPGTPHQVATYLGTMGIKYETEFGSHFVSGKELLKLPPATLVEYGVYSNRIDTLTRALATLRMICLEPDINEWKRVRK